MIDVSDNWWGVNNFTDKSDVNVSAKNNVILSSYVVIRFRVSEYFVEDNTVKKARLNVNMNYNNLNQDLTIKGHLMDGIDIIFYTLNSTFSFEKLNNGYASVLIDLNDQYIDDNVILCAILDYSIELINLCENESIYYTIYSSAINNDSKLILSGDFNYSSVSWFSVSWSETGIYSAEINIIINGEIVESVNVTNEYYLRYYSVYGDNVFMAMKEFNNIFASTKEDVFVANNFLFQLKEYNFITNIDNSNYTKGEVLNNFIAPLYSLSDVEKDFIMSNHIYFVDDIFISINYGAGYTPDIVFNNTKLKFPSGIINRNSNIYYTNILDENNCSVGYEGMRSFCLATSQITSEVLSFWLNKSNDYEPGLMKAAYGTFLTDLIVMYELDCVACLAGEAFNVTWLRSSPAAFSLCNDFNSLYITGESDHGMGMCVNGSESDVWKFRFTCSFAYSLVEQLVGSNIWQDYNIGSVTLGILQSFMNNNSLELFYENGYYFLKIKDDDYFLLVLDPFTGIVRDIFSFNGLLATMPCYHDMITDNAVRYGNNLLDETSVSYSQLNSVADYSKSFALIGGVFVGDSLFAVGETVSVATLSTVGCVFFVIALPVVFELSRPKLAEMMDEMGFYEMAQYYYTNNTLYMMNDAVEYFTFGELEDVPFEQRLMLSLLYLSNIQYNGQFIAHMIINPNSDLYEFIQFDSIKIDDFYRSQDELSIIYNNGGASIDPKKPPQYWGEELNRQTNILKESFYKLNVIGIIRSICEINFIFLSFEASLLDAWGDDIINYIFR